jgi:hypothetical protein
MRAILRLDLITLSCFTVLLIGRSMVLLRVSLMVGVTIDVTFPQKNWKNSRLKVRWKEDTWISSLGNLKYPASL